MKALPFALRASLLTIVLTGATMASANDVVWQSLTGPTSGVGGTTIAFLATVTNPNSYEFGSDHYIAMRDSAGTVVALGNLAWLGSGETATREVVFTLPNVTATLTYTFQAVEHNVEWFGDLQTRSIAITAAPPYMGMQLSATTFSAATPPVISTTDNVTGSPWYRLRAKVIDGTQYGWHMANLWNTNNYPVDSPAPVGSYAICALYWVRYTGLWGDIVYPIGPERRVAITVQDTVRLSSYAFHSAAPPQILTNDNLGASYRLFATFSNGQGGTWETAGGLNNSGATLASLPPAGTYQASLCWKTYDAGGAVLATGPVNVKTVTISAGPTVVLASGVELGDFNWTDDDGNGHTDVAVEWFEVTIATPGTLVVRNPAGGADTRGELLNASDTVLAAGDHPLSAAVVPGVYRVSVTASQTGHYDILGELTPSATPTAITSGGTAAGTAGTAFTGYVATASGTGPIAFSASNLPPGLTIHSGTGTVSGVPTAGGTYSAWIAAVNVAGSNGRTVDFTIAVPAPSNLHATETSARYVALAWNPPAGSMPVGAYEISQGPGVMTSTSASPTTFLVGGLVAGTSYTFQVRTVDLSGNCSAWVSFTITTSTTVGSPSGTSQWVNLFRNDRIPSAGPVFYTPPDGIYDEVIGVDQNRFAAQLTHATWNFPFQNFWTLWGITWPDGTFTPNFMYAVMLSLNWEDDAPAATTIDVDLSFTAEPGQEYFVVRDDSQSHVFNPANFAIVEFPRLYPTGSPAHVYTGLWPEELQYARFYLIRYAKPIGSISSGSASAGSPGTTRGGGGTLNVPFPITGNVTISVKDTVGALLKAGSKVGWQVWNGISQIRVGTSTLGDLIDIGITTSGQFQVGLQLDDANVVWFNITVAALPSPAIAVDANRDGQIALDGTDATGAATPYRFWLNDDDDRSYDTVAWSDSDPERYPPQQADSADQIINSPRDSEDLSRIWINAAVLIDTVKDPASDLYLGLKWKNTNGTHPAIRLFRSADPNGGLGHIKDATIGLQQATITPPGGVGALRSCLGDADAATISNPPAAFPWTSGITQVEPIVRDADFIFRKDALPGVFGNRSTGYLLFEGVQEGNGELGLVIVRKKSDGTWEKASDGGSVWLQLDNIRRMYVRTHSTPLPENFPHPWQVTSPPSGPYDEDLAHEKALSIPDNRLWYGAGDSVESSTTFPFVPSPGEQNKCVIFVHGIDMNVPEMHGYTHSFFKRLWWEGYRGRFISFRWCTPLTTDGQWGYSDNAENTSIFNSGEYRSWKGGASLKKFADALRNPASPFYFSSNPMVGLLAHSLGNACAGEALRQGMQVNSYVALKAAVPLSCYYPIGTPAPINQALVDADAIHPTPQYAGFYNGYHGYLDSIGGANKVNYYGANDFWLATGSTSLGLSVNWVTNQRKYKPDDPLDGFMGTALIKYLWDGNQLKSYFRRDAFYRKVTDPHEGMAFVSRPRTSAVGAVSPALTGLPGFTGLDLESPATYAMGPARFDHSGPFQRNIQLMYGNENGVPWSEPLYVRLMRDLQVSP